MGFGNWHPCPWVFRAMFCITFVFADSRTELLLEDPSAAGVNPMGCVGMDINHA